MSSIAGDAPFAGDRSRSALLGLPSPNLISPRRKSFLAWTFDFLHHDRIVNEISNTPSATETIKMISLLSTCESFLDDSSVLP
jgi:hypothetical protein